MDRFQETPRSAVKTADGEFRTHLILQPNASLVTLQGLTRHFELRLCPLLGLFPRCLRSFTSTWDHSSPRAKHAPIPRYILISTWKASSTSCPVRVLSDKPKYYCSYAYKSQRRYHQKDSIFQEFELVMCRSHDANDAVCASAEKAPTSQICSVVGCVAVGSVQCEWFVRVLTPTPHYIKSLYQLPPIRVSTFGSPASRASKAPIAMSDEASVTTNYVH